MTAHQQEMQAARKTKLDKDYQMHQTRCDSFEEHRNQLKSLLYEEKFSALNGLQINQIIGIEFN